MASEADDTSVLLVCSGLDHARRGFETFARECFEALRDVPGVALELAKGSGPSGPGERSLPTLRRDRAVARAVGRLAGARPFRIEALSLAFSLQPLLARRRPEVVYFSEWDTGRALAALRTLSRQRFKLLLCNGGFAERFDGFDHVQELTPAGRDHVIALGADPRRHTLLPLGFKIPRAFEQPTASERATLRVRFGLPADRTIVISLAALNSHHKRVDYLINEMAELPVPRPFLLLVGQEEDETPPLRALANSRLEADGYDIRTVAPSDVPDLLRASDLFALASIAETQGRVLVEAMSVGLPCLAHDSPVTRFALGDHGSLADLTRPGALTGLLRADHDSSAAAAHARHSFVYDVFSWDRLSPTYVEFLRAVAEGARPNSTVSS